MLAAQSAFPSGPLASFHKKLVKEFGDESHFSMKFNGSPQSCLKIPYIPS
jgi:hypothetical protein